MRIAFGHKARSGKDTAADILVSEYGYTIVRFTGPVYEIANKIQTLKSALNRDDVSRIVHEVTGHYAPDDWLDKLFVELAIRGNHSQGQPGEKVIWLLILIGNGLRDYIDANIWVNLAQAKIATIKGSIVVPDLRFPNEASMLRDNGFSMIGVHRPDRPIDRDPNDISEIALSGFKWDYEINNVGTLSEFKCKLRRLFRIIELISKHMILSKL